MKQPFNIYFRYIKKNCEYILRFEVLHFPSNIKLQLMLSITFILIKFSKTIRLIIIILRCVFFCLLIFRLTWADPSLLIWVFWVYIDSDNWNKRRADAVKHDQALSWIFEQVFCISILVDRTAFRKHGC